MRLPPLPDTIHVLVSFEVIPVLRLRQPPPLTLFLVGLSATGLIAVFLPITIATIRKEQLPAMLALASSSFLHPACWSLTAKSSGQFQSNAPGQRPIQAGKKIPYLSEVKEENQPKKIHFQIAIFTASSSRRCDIPHDD
jgi:hypothetical protein